MRHTPLRLMNLESMVREYVFQGQCICRRTCTKVEITKKSPSRIQMIPNGYAGVAPARVRDALRVHRLGRRTVHCHRQDAGASAARPDT